jgi:hypothetical protein
MKAKDLQEIIDDLDPEMDIVILVCDKECEHYEYDIDIYETDDPVTKKIVLVFDPNTS